ncbi:MAG: AAA family ATPase [Oscillospiraceae bacterium]|nr:AAA family ATPase [Oscillospiraceae bacterium]
MIIQRMQANFGKLENQTLELQPGLNLLDGENESGKSTWRAFLAAMFYGIETRERGKGGQLPDKLKYLPWSGRPMEGRMELQLEGKNLILERSSKTTPMGAFSLRDRDSGEALPGINGKNCGSRLLGAESGLYLRSAMIVQKQIPVSADPNLEKRLSALVTTGGEDYAYAELDEKLKKLESALSRNPGGALPKARAALEQTKQQIANICEARRSLTQLEAELHTLKVRQEEQRRILAGLDALEQQKKRERLQTAQSALDAAVENRLGWEAVCAELPDEAKLLALQRELQQLQTQLQDALDRRDEAPTEPEPDPVFGMMDAQSAHDKTAADALVIQRAAKAQPSASRRFPLWLISLLGGLSLGIFGVLRNSPVATGVGAALLLAGLVWCAVLGMRRRRSLAEYQQLQQAAEAVLKQYGAENAKGVVMRGIAYIRSLEDREFETGGIPAREELELLSRRRDSLLSQLERVMPGCSSMERAAVLFQEAAQSRQALEQARLLEEQRRRQLEDLRFAVGPIAPADPEASRFASFDRDTVLETLEGLEAKLEARSSQINRLYGALTQMGDLFALTAEQAELETQILRMEQRLEALSLARTALREADASLRSRFSPLLCKRTGELFQRLSGGKYDQVQLDRELRVTVHPTDGTVFLSLSYLSGGAVDQLYLALRLAICELLLPQAPIVLDDALVYFDDHRAALALETLLELSQHRQILLFSCQSRERVLLRKLSAGQLGGIHEQSNHSV